VLKLSQATSLGIHTAAYLAGRPDQVVTTRQVASALGVSENHLAKVLQRLTKAGLVRSVRGPRGGFMLSRPPDEVTLLDVYEAIDGPLVLSDCLLETPVCNGQCILGDLLSKVNGLVKDRFTNTRLSAMPQLSEVGHG